MGDTFNPGPRVRRITFEDDTEFPGLWMRVKGLTFREWLDTKLVGEAFDQFAERLIEWNWVDDEGQPVPPTAEGLGTLDARDVGLLLAAYHNRVAEVREAPLDRTPSPQADPDLEAEIHMLPPPAAESS